MKDITISMKNLNKLLIQNIKYIESTYQINDIVEKLYMEFALDSQKILKLTGIEHEYIGKHVFLGNFNNKSFTAGILRIYGTYIPPRKKPKRFKHLNSFRDNSYKETRLG